MIHGAYVYAFTLGLVSAVNPCGFPLLPAFLTLLAGSDRGGTWTQRTARGLHAGASVTLGFVFVFGLFGLLVESGVDALGHWIPWAMIPLGLALAVLGALELFGKAPRMTPPSVSISPFGRVLAPVVFGVGYGLASLSCALPLFLAGVAGSFTRLGISNGGITVLAYSLGMGLFLLAASLAVSWAGPALLHRLRPAGALVRPFSGSVLVIVGGYLSYYWASDAIAPTRTPHLTARVEAVQVSISDWISSHAKPLGVVFGVVVIGACTFLAFRAEDDSSDRPSHEAKTDPAWRLIQKGATRDDGRGDHDPAPRRGADTG